MKKYDVIIVGGGSAGCGAAVTAAKRGFKTLLLEAENMLGGNSTTAMVNCYEPDVGGNSPVAKEIYERLRKIPESVGIYSFGRHMGHPDHNDPPFPGGENLIYPDRSYNDTLKRSGTAGMSKADKIDYIRKHWNGVIFEPEVWHQVVLEMLEESGCEVRLNNPVKKCKCENSEIISVTTENNQELFADIYIDCCGILISSANLPYIMGTDSQKRFNEPSAPEFSDNSLNGITLVFRISRKSETGIDPLPDGVSPECDWAETFPVMSMVQYPNGDFNCNMLPTMDGKEFSLMQYDEAYQECNRRVLKFFHYIQTNYPEFQNYKIDRIASKIGVRESIRTICEYMLTENDIREGRSNQKHSDIVAFADHAVDVHGAHGRGCCELMEPYGIPLRCMIPKGKDNLYVAGRIAGFSSIAASSCRLSRTMISLGEAVANALAHSTETASGRSSLKKLEFDDIDK